MIERHRTLKATEPKPGCACNCSDNSEKLSKTLKYVKMNDLKRIYLLLAWQGISES